MNTSKKLTEILKAHNCRILNHCSGPNGSRLEFWQCFNKGARGVLIAQVWPDGSTVTFVDWPTGSTWKSLEDCLDGLSATSVDAIDKNT